MHASTLASLVLLASSVLAAPLQLPSLNSTDRLVLPQNSSLPLNVTDTAGGDAPNAPLTAYITDAVIAQFWIANFLEDLEASFFEAGAKNLTEWGTEGYPAGTLEVVRRVAAQEQVHVATITDILTAYNHLPLQTCKYQFPVTSTAEFLALAQIITTVGIGAILDISATLAELAPLLLPSLTSLLTVEARHDAFFRSAAANLVPNPAPFDTRISTVWALNLAWPFVVPGSCPTPVEFPFFPPLNIGVSTTTGGGVRRRCESASASVSVEAAAAAAATSISFPSPSTSPTSTSSGTSSAMASATFPATTAPTDHPYSATFASIFTSISTSSATSRATAFSTSSATSPSTSPSPISTSPSPSTTSPISSTSPIPSTSASPIPSPPPTPPTTSITFTLPPPYAPYLTLYVLTTPPSPPLYIAWVNQANVPIYTAATVRDDGGSVETAVPPGLAGTVFAALTGQNWEWNCTGLAGATVAGPVVVRVS